MSKDLACPPIYISMSWDQGDLHGVISHTQHGIGQINMDSKIGVALASIAALPTVKTLLEVGTWNGLGSTRCIVEGLRRRAVDQPYTFYSLEANSEKWGIARDFYKDMPDVHILNEVFYNDEPADQLTVFPELAENSTYQHWHNIDMQNMKSKPVFWNRADLPQTFDMVLLDGGEFTTWYEYQHIKDRCRILVLDDTNVSKCSRIVQELKSQPERWNIIMENEERNGNLIALRHDA